ncbi:lysozyme [Endozoicomonas numazuensis]|uniref:Lysozyme n=1 Tax=Endozoicomonas numazuensis TaxID=1137799 RepID=A0A081NGH9_9GAMM|nr:lysozyme [Endozoicomonas numazuensis]KEQ17552.1 hypothetical protein GZ78_17565 [Endozoicomonas numazuensis]
MKISDVGLDHLIKLEGGIQLTRYNDLGKNSGHCTIGVGHLIHKGVCNGIVPSEKPFLKGITVKRAKELLRKDILIAESTIKGSVTSTLNQNQYDALVSFVFNIGGPQFRNSTLLKYLNSKQSNKASDEFLKWNKMTIGGRKIEVKGLTNRRIAEKHLFDMEVK